MYCYADEGIGLVLLVESACKDISYSLGLISLLPLCSIAPRKVSYACRII